MKVGICKNISGNKVCERGNFLAETEVNGETKSFFGKLKIALIFKTHLDRRTELRLQKVFEICIHTQHQPHPHKEKNSF